MTPRELIRVSLRAISALNDDRSPSSDQHEDALETLNLMLDSWSAEELLPFDYVQKNFPLVAGKTNYTIGDSTTAADADGISVAQTLAAAPEDLTITGDLADDGSVTMDVPRHVTIYAAADNSGVEFTITGTNTYGDAITEVLTGPTAGATVYGTKQFKTVTTVAVDANSTGDVTVGSDSVIDTRRPLMIISAFVRNSSGNDFQTYPGTREVYSRVADKDASTTVGSEINMIYYDRTFPTGEIYIYKVPSVSTFNLYMDMQQPFQQITAANIDNEINLPGEYVLALKWNLAIELSPDYGKEIKDIVISRATDTLNAIRRINARLPKPTPLTMPIPVLDGQPATNKT